MDHGWQARQQWDSDPSAAFQEAERRIATCVETKDDRLSLNDLKLQHLPHSISALQWLRELGVYGSPIADFTPIAALENLEALKLGSLHCAFPGLGFLAGWTKLRELDLICAGPLDMFPLKSCVQLARLSIHSTQTPALLQNFECLVDLPAVKHLSLNNMRSDRFDILGMWGELRFLQLIDAGPISLEGFENLRHLEHLNLHGCKVADLSPLADLSMLQDLDISGTEAFDLSPLCTLAALRELRIANTGVDDLRPLAVLAAHQKDEGGRGPRSSFTGTGLRSLDLSGCPVSDLAPLAGCEHLETVDLSRSQVRSLVPLHGGRNLRSLRLVGAPIERLGPPGSFCHLDALNASQTAIDDISALAPAPRLQVLDIADTRVSDLRPLKDARECRTLILRGSRVRDLSPLLETGSHEEDHRYSAQALDFRETPAAQASTRLAELAALAETDRTACFHETKRYLEGRRTLRKGIRPLLSLSFRRG